MKLRTYTQNCCPGRRYNSLKGSTVATHSDTDGYFTLYTAPFAGAILVYTKEGCRTQEISTRLQRGITTSQSVAMDK